MKRLLALTVSLSLLPLAASLPASAQDANEETQLISVLQSDHPLQEKDAACAQLKRIGTTQCVPVLGKLLADPDLSHSARYALESMPGVEAEDALRQALAKTSGSNEVGIIMSLGTRGETAAVPDVTKLLTSSDPAVAVAAAQALGKTPGSDALAALASGWSASPASLVHDAERDGLLACANRMLIGNDASQALPIFQKLYDGEKDGGVKLAAYRGVILASGPHGFDLMVEAIAGPDSPSQGAALSLASKLGGTATTAALGKVLPKLTAPMQIALLQSLAQRNDPSAQPYIISMIDSTDSNVRMAAIAALADLGDDAVALSLARLAASASGAEKSAARQSLEDLHRGPVTEALLKPLADATPEVQSELVRALGNRGDVSAAPKLLELARGQNDLTRSAALQGLALLAGPAQVPDLIQLVVTATNDDARSAAADALGSVCQHIQSQNGRMDTTPLAQAARSGPVEARVALLGVCSGVSDPQVREVLRAMASDADARVREAALRALCDTRDPELLPDLLKVACDASENKIRLLAIHGCVRLTTQDENVKLPGDTKVATLKTIIGTPLAAPEKRLVLAGLGTLRDRRALALAAAMLDDPAVRTEAAEAVIRIAGSISKARPQEAGAALKKVLALSVDPATRKSAETAYKKIQ
jgi:HEAT repeat protein